ncbi:hypothetical protein B9Z55_005678 [Caenorhabditis nigoni]|uniref:Uncharacterized protein n=1 Tax=Caenorhabditis nigoni TaxID=1611254 RepID=A0A2G5V2P5_9PELO|nr:hypothetical protein B9Z55_005678 [Caenorhabditis nigoni]
MAAASPGSASRFFLVLSVWGSLFCCPPVLVSAPGTGHRRGATADIKWEKDSVCSAENAEAEWTPANPGLGLLSHPTPLTDWPSLFTGRLVSDVNDIRRNGCVDVNGFGLPRHTSLGVCGARIVSGKLFWTVFFPRPTVGLIRVVEKFPVFSDS